MAPSKNAREYEDTTSTTSAICMHSIVQPPPDLQGTIEAVARLVAERGSGIDFQLRSEDHGRDAFPFLWLDDVYAPFYQLKLQEARTRLSAGETAAPSTAHNLCDTAIGPTSSEAALSECSLRAEEGTPALLHNCHHELEEVSSGSIVGSREESCDYQSLYHDQYWAQPLANAYDQEGYANHEHNSGSFAPSGYIAHPESQSADHYRTGLPATHAPRRSKYPQFGLLQEVHVLDSAGTDCSGLNTFIITTSDEAEARDPSTACYQSPAVAMTDEPVYRLRPDIRMILRVPHHRLLPVGFALGEEVKQIDNCVASIVVRRTVRNRQRLYDVRDEFGEVHEGVPEGMLKSHAGACFSFRLPHSNFTPDPNNHGPTGEEQL